MVLNWINPPAETIGVEIYRYTSNNVLYESIQINDGYVTYNDNKKGYINPNKIGELIEKHRMESWGERYGDSLEPQKYDKISIVKGSHIRFIHHEPSAPIYIGSFVDQISKLSRDAVGIV